MVGGGAAVCIAGTDVLVARGRRRRRTDDARLRSAIITNSTRRPLGVAVFPVWSFSLMCVSRRRSDAYHRLGDVRPSWWLGWSRFHTSLPHFFPSQKEGASGWGPWRAISAAAGRGPTPSGELPGALATLRRAVGPVSMRKLARTVAEEHTRGESEEKTEATAAT